MRPQVALLLVICIGTGCLDSDPRLAHENPAALHFGIPNDPSSLDPAATTDPIYFQVAFNVFETLLATDWKANVYVPLLATKWEVDSSGRLWTFLLRTGVVFHDGSPFNAEAVKISLERQYDQHSPYFVRDTTDAYSTFAFTMLKEIRAVNDSTVQFVLNHPHPAFLDLLASPELCSIVSPKALQLFGNEFGRRPCGTGPFRFSEWQPGRQIVLKRFRDYWGKPANLDSAIYLVMPSLEARLQQLRDGRLDVISGLSAASIDRLYRTRGVLVIEESLLSTTYLGFDCSRAPLSDERFRRAIAHAVNTRELVHGISKGLASIAKGPLPPLARDFDSSLAGIDYDPAASQALLQEIGPFDKPGFTIHCFVETDSERGNPMIHALCQCLEKLGIKCKPVWHSTWESYTRALQNGEAPLFWEGWKGPARHSHYFLFPRFHSQSPHNVFRYKNATVDSLLELALRTPRPEDQKRLYQQAQQLIVQDTPAVFVSHPKAVYAVRDRVKNFIVDPLAIPNLHLVEKN